MNNTQTVSASDEAASAALSNYIDGRFTSDKDRVIFARLGVLARELQRTLSELGADGVLYDAAREFPSARDRLEHIGQLTSNAANTVLDTVEQHKPVQEKLHSQAAALATAWTAISPDGPVPLILRQQTLDHLRHVETNTATMSAALSSVMMAQDFQDLTGQLIKKLVTLLERTENDLIRLLIDAAPQEAPCSVTEEDLTAGPGAHGSVALDQQNVDDLLAEMGF